MESDEIQDFINKLPNDILAYILSKLQVDEAVRCNILSKRWVGLWKQSPHIEFNAKHMIKPMTQLLHTKESLKHQDSILNPFMQKVVYRYGILMFQLMCRHYGNMSSCRVLHFRKSLSIGEVNAWINLLLIKNKGLKHLSLECLPNYGDEIVHEDKINEPCFSHRIFHCLDSLELINYTIDCWSSFEDCHNLKILKLERIHLDEAMLSGILENCVVLENFSLIESNGFMKLIIMKSTLKVLRLQALCVEHLQIVAKNLEILFLDSIICPMKNLSIYAPSLHNFESHWYSRRLIQERKNIMKTYEILACFIDRWVSPITFNITSFT